MFFLGILQEFLLPSSLILIFFIVGVFFLFRCRLLISKVLLISAIIFYYLFSISPVADFILSPLEGKYEPVIGENLKQTNVVVLLLGGKESDILRTSEVLRITNIKDEQTKVIVTGVDPINSGEKAANEVKQFFINRGLKESNIILETKSINTSDSAKNVEELIGEKPFFLVTSAYHMQRSIESFVKAGTNPIPAPTDFKTKENYNVFNFFPDSRNLRKTDLAFHEYFGILFYRIFNR